jgi:hypothetical protein
MALVVAAGGLAPAAAQPINTKCQYPYYAEYYCGYPEYFPAFLNPYPVYYYYPVPYYYPYPPSAGYGPGGYYNYPPPAAPGR